ncbi:hypothetical protein ABEB36_007189 [Hypothenemus hampei]|uniref:B3/B4 tRNA-binding domain-containing protein n=1 Tax=Hypothenemus hampei TaxID=57062 RepID=A0ABD1ETA4_HYPHA
MWPEIETVKNEKRRELVLSGMEISERIKKTGLDPDLFTLTDLNYFSLTETCLQDIGSDISELLNLQTLILHSNRLETFNDAITRLPKLKILDVSSNFIKTLPESIASLSQIVSLNFSNNQLDSFPNLIDTSKLCVLDLSENRLTTFPDIISPKLTCLSELKLQRNNIEVIPNSITQLPALKTLNLNDNKIKTLPGELADCHKLKEVNLQGNPINDKRLFKLINQCRTKQILDYVKQNCPKTTNNINESSKKGKSKKNSEKDLESSQSEDNLVEYKYKISIKPSDESFKVVVDNSTKSIREHIVCCLINNINFTEETCKSFIKLQNKLHDGICNKRNSATIATHDFKKLESSMVKYTTFPPDKLIIKPLNHPNEITGAQLFTKLQIEANNLRKLKKKTTYSGIHKYLYLIEGKPVYPCLINEKQVVISFPPITNSDVTKIESSTTKIFVEVTSSLSQFACKNAMGELLKEMISLLETDLEVQQVRILNEEDQLKVIFPAKNDLIFDKNLAINVIRI